MHMKNISKDVGPCYRVLITGANGFTGQHACTYFANQGYNVFGTVRKLTSTPHQEFHVVPCDLSDSLKVKETIRSVQPDFILHLAGQNSVPKSWETPVESIETNVMCTAYLLDAIRLLQPRCRIIVVGSMLQSTLNDSLSFLHPYSLSKTMQSLLTEVLSSLFELDCIIAKPTNLIGPGFSTGICSVLANQFVQLERGEGKKVMEIHNLLAARDFLDVRDAVKAYETIFLKGTPRKVYEVTSGEAKSIQEVLETFMNLTGASFELKTKIHQPEQVDIVQPTELKALGWAPAIAFQQSLCDILQFYREAV